jgi:hypothetical protein
MAVANMRRPGRPMGRNQMSRKIFTEPFDLPEEKENEELHVYVSTFKDDSPFIEKHVGGIMFRRFVLDPSWSLAENADKSFPQETPKILLTEREAEAIMERAKEVDDKLPAPHYEDGSVGRAEKCFLSDHIVLEKLEDYMQRHVNEVKRKMNPNFQDNVKEQKPITQDTLKDELITQQKGNRRGKK